MLSEFQEEDIGSVHRTVTTSELDINPLKPLTTPYTAIQYTDGQSRSSFSPDDGVHILNTDI